MKKRVTTVATIIIISFLIAIFASAQQAQRATQGDAAFKANSNLVILDVTVLDKSGKVVSGLAKNDFQVLEDGKAQNVSVFEFQKLENDPATTAPLAPPSVLKAVATPAPKAAPAKPAISTSQAGAIKFQDRRLVVMLFDLSSMQPDDQVHANEAATTFLTTKLQPNDMVAIMVNSTSLNVAQDFTNDKDQLISVIKKLSIGQSSDLANFGTNGDMTTGEDTGAAFE
jgi:VWFA-related protein